MIGQELIIKFYSDKAFITESTSLSLTQIDGLDNYKHFKAPAYWSIKVLNHNVIERKLYCSINSYKVGDINFSLNQQLLFETLSEIQKITFKDIDTIGLIASRAGKTGLSYKPSKNSNITERKSNFPTSIKNTQSSILKPAEFSFKESFSIPIKKVQFINGGISFTKKFKSYIKQIQLTIYNPAIIEEYDAIKNYFSNVLKTKNLEIEAEITIIDGEVASTKAESPEIRKINNDFLEHVKLSYLTSTLQKIRERECDKTFISLDNLLNIPNENNFDSKLFYNNTDDLFEDILSVTKAKHYYQLRFLSSKHSSEIMKLRFIYKPLSFVFLLEGSHHFYIVWETLNTEEATYAWPIGKVFNNIKTRLKYIENIINNIKDSGKISYINDTEDKFERIYHNYSEEMQGFKKWKIEMENLLKLKF